MSTVLVEKQLLVNNLEGAVAAIEDQVSVNALHAIHDSRQIHANPEMGVAVNCGIMRSRECF